MTGCGLLSNATMLEVGPRYRIALNTTTVLLAVGIGLMLWTDEALVGVGVGYCLCVLVDLIRNG